MALHLLAYDGASSTTKWTQITAVADVITRSNDNYVLSSPMNLYAAFAIGAATSGFRINSPTLRQTLLPQVLPFNVGATVPNPPLLAVYPASHPLKLAASEEIRAESYISTGTTNTELGLVIGDSIVPSPQGPVYTWHGTSTTAAVASTWTQLSVTYDDSLPSGQYAVVGLSVANTTGIFCRAYTAGMGYRPGGLCTVGTGHPTHPLFRMGNLGTWFVFNNFVGITVEVLCESTDNAHDVYVDLVKVS